MHLRSKWLIAAATGLALSCGNDSPTPVAPTPTPPAPPGPLESLKAAAADRGKLVGTAVQAGPSRQPAVQHRRRSGVQLHHGRIRNEVEHRRAQPGVQQLRRRRRHRRAMRCRSGVQRVKGHTLIWHGATPVVGERSSVHDGFPRRVRTPTPHGGKLLPRPRRRVGRRQRSGLRLNGALRDTVFLHSSDPHTSPTRSARRITPTATRSSTTTTTVSTRIDTEVDRGLSTFVQLDRFVNARRADRWCRLSDAPRGSQRTVETAAMVANFRALRRARASA